MCGAGRICRTSLVPLVLSVVLGGSAVRADLVTTFDIGAQLPNGNPVVLNLLGLSDNGVTFDARLTMIGSSSLVTSANGVGVGNSRIETGETIDFLLSVHNVSGGYVSIDGFTSVALRFADDPADRATFYKDAARTLAYATLNGTNAITFPQPLHAALYLSGQDGVGGKTSFSVKALSARFRGTSVPEPHSLLLLACGTISIVAGSIGRRIARSCRLMS